METFVVRVWKPGAEDRPEGLRGTATHLSSGVSVTFTEPDALVRFLTVDQQGLRPTTHPIDDVEQR
jgi:hypothetical protein